MSTAPEELKRLRAVQRTLTDTRRSYRRQLSELQDELERKNALLEQRDAELAAVRARLDSVLYGEDKERAEELEEREADHAAELRRLQKERERAQAQAADELKLAAARAAQAARAEAKAEIAQLQERIAQLEQASAAPHPERPRLVAATPAHGALVHPPRLSAATPGAPLHQVAAAAPATLQAAAPDQELARLPPESEAVRAEPGLEPEPEPEPRWAGSPQVRQQLQALEQLHADGLLSPEVYASAQSAAVAADIPAASAGAGAGAGAGVGLGGGAATLATTAALRGELVRLRRLVVALQADMAALLPRAAQRITKKIEAAMRARPHSAPPPVVRAPLASLTPVVS